MTITANYNVISTFGSIYFNFSGESPVNERIPSPVIAPKTLISKMKQIQKKTYSLVHESSLGEEDSIECPLKDVQFLIKNQKGSKQPLRRSPWKQINIDQSSSEPGPSKKSSAPKAQSSSTYRNGGSSIK